MSTLEQIFKLKENKTSVKTEIIAGFTTFVTMVYILAVNPAILSATGMDPGGLFTATAIMCVFGTILMAVIAKYPFALAPGMGLNAFFAYVVVVQVGGNWYNGLVLLLIQGVGFVALASIKFRERIFEAIPKSMKLAIGVGIGLFILHIGLQNAGFVVSHPATLVTLGNMRSVPVVIFMIGVIITGFFLAKRITGGLLWGMLCTYLIGLLAQLAGIYEVGVHGASLIPAGLIALPPSLAEVNLITNISQVDFGGISMFTIVTLMIVLLIVEGLDTVGTAIGVSEKCEDFLDKDGDLPRKGRVLLADALTTSIGALFGTSTTTTYIESASGVQAGGRTGLTGWVVAILFAIAMFFWPLFSVIPAFATAPALVYVGLFMTTTVAKIVWDDAKHKGEIDFTEALPAFLIMVLMPLTYSISDGVVFGTLAYVILKVLVGKYKDPSAMMYILAAFFALKLVFQF
ncbi:MAG: NCS2 family permease [Defluviitaleaceae bacterium]|nr:NCS2 family permease [Defluviitaleaceae bacterium]